jgi:hypothetical protein
MGMVATPARPNVPFEVLSLVSLSLAASPSEKLVDCTALDSTGRPSSAAVDRPLSSDNVASSDA